MFSLARSGVTLVPETGLSILVNLMNAKGGFDPEELLADARGGRTESLGRVLELNRTDLALLARAQIHLGLQGRVDASDLVQETFLDACRDFHHFRGTSHGEWVAWLRKILFCNLARVVQRQVAARKRSTRREVSLDRQLSTMERSSGAIQIHAALVSRTSSPSSHAGRRERVACLGDQLARLPADYREVLVLGNREGLPFPEVARHVRQWAGLPEPCASSGCARSISSAGCCKRRNSYERQRARRRRARADQ